MVKSSQKVTVKKISPAELEQAKVKELLKKDKITLDDISTLSKSEFEKFNEKVIAGLHNYKDEELDDLISRTELIIDQSTKNQLWEWNHNKITKAINDYVIEYGMPPTKSTLAATTGLSRKTIYKHVKDFETNPLYTAITQDFKMLKGRLLTRLYRLAIERCDVKAARLFLEATDGLPGTIRNQTNNIQINGVTVSAQTFEHLAPNQQSAILKILQEARLGEREPEKT